jgi:hypothetical protein
LGGIGGRRGHDRLGKVKGRRRSAERGRKKRGKGKEKEKEREREIRG